MGWNERILAAMESIASGAVTLQVDNIEFDTGALATAAKQDTIISSLSALGDIETAVETVSGAVGSGMMAVDIQNIGTYYDGVLYDSSGGYGIADLLYDSSGGSVAYIMYMIYSLLSDVISGSSNFYVYNNN